MAKRESKPIRGSTNIRRRAKELRKQATPAEKILWEQLRNRQLHGLKFRRQHPIGNFIVDFYCPAQRLVVEIDGDLHRYQETEDQARKDLLEEKGYRVIRFWNSEVEENLERVLKIIKENCDLPSPNFGRRVGEEGNP
jgi:very-short-patch-repair endonuclease